MDADSPESSSGREDSPRRTWAAEIHETPELCATCRRPLVRQGNQGVCVYCLVNFAAPSDDDALEEEPSPSGSFTNAPRRYGHFEILANPDGSSVELGHGAMGITYRAQDTVLHRAVALKVIDRGVAEQPAIRTRFLREARAAAQFQHPNVAAVSHYGEEAGECFYAMELVEGETLEERVRKEGPLPAAQTLEIALQVTRALMAAENRGIVHRDLKPTNLMLTSVEAQSGVEGVPVVKVIDFGLAKALNTAPVITGEHETRGAFVGTPAFASPEQFDRAGENRVDHRADIYSLGATMWYALVGCAPFTGRTLTEIHLRQSEALPLAQLTAAKVPPPVVKLLDSMLAVDPARRPQSGRSLYEALQRCRDQVLAAERRARWMKKGPITAALVLCMAAAIIAGVWRLRGGAQREPDKQSIAVLPFDNLSPNPDDAFFTTGMQDEVIADLAHLAALKVIGPDSTRHYPPGKRDLARIGQELGVSHLLEGSVRRDGERVHVEVRLVDTHHVDHPWSAEYDRKLADVFMVQGEITRAIADQLQTPLSVGEKRAINEPPTTDLAAYDLYLRAREIPELAYDPKTLFEHEAKKTELLDAAVARDPKFVLAYCSLANIHDEAFLYRSYATPEQRAVDHRALAENALQKARLLRPDAGEVHFAYAVHFHQVNEDDEQAQYELTLARRTLPNDAELEQLGGAINQSQGRWEEALRCFQRGVALEPRELVDIFWLADTYHLMRRWDDFIRASTQKEALCPPSDRQARKWHAELGLERDADLAPLRAFIAAATPDEHEALDENDQLVLHLFERDADALSRALLAATHAKFTYGSMVLPKAWYEGLAARLRGDPAGARTAFTAARTEAEKTVAADAGDGLNLSLLAMIDAGIGRDDFALEEAARAVKMPRGRSALRAPRVGSNLAVVYAWTGHVDLAISKLQELIKDASGANFPLQPSYGDLTLNPVWDPLRGDRRFAALVEQLAPTQAEKSSTP